MEEARLDINKKIESWKEDAEKWRELEARTEMGNILHDLLNCRCQLDLILSMLEVRVECDCIGIHRSEPCEDCEDKGYTTRPATAEDVKELLIAILGSENCDIYLVASTMSFELQSGEILRMKEKKC